MEIGCLRLAVNRVESPVVGVLKDAWSRAEAPIRKTHRATGGLRDLVGDVGGRDEERRAGVGDDLQFVKATVSLLIWESHLVLVVVGDLADRDALHLELVVRGGRERLVAEHGAAVRRVDGAPRVDACGAVG